MIKVAGGILVKTAIGAGYNPELLANIVRHLEPTATGRYILPTIAGGAGGAAAGYFTGDDDTKWRRALLGSLAGAGLGAAGGYVRPYRTDAGLRLEGPKVHLHQRVYHPWSDTLKDWKEPVHTAVTGSPESAKELREAVIRAHGTDPDNRLRRLVAVPKKSKPAPAAEPKAEPEAAAKPESSEESTEKAAKSVLSPEQAIASMMAEKLPGRFERYVAPTAIGGVLGTGAGYFTTPPESAENRPTNMLTAGLIGAGLGAGAGWARKFRVGNPEFAHDPDTKMVIMRQNKVRPWIGVPEPKIDAVDVESPEVAEEIATQLQQAVGHKSLAEWILSLGTGIIDEGPKKAK